MRNGLILAGMLLLLALPLAAAPAPDAAATFREGLNAYFMGSYEEAAGYFTRAVGLSGTNETYRYYLGRTHEKLNRPERAIEEYKAVLRLKPDHIPARVALGNLYFERNATDLAIEQYRALAERSPDYYQAYHRLGVLYLNTNNFPEAERNLLKAVAMEPADPQPHFHLGRTLVRQQRWLDAINRLTEAIRLSPGEGEYYYWRANAHYAREDYNSDKEGYWLSVDDYSTAIELGYATPQCYFMFGNTQLNRAIYLANNHRDKEGIETLKTAIVQFKKVIALDPNASNAFNNLGLAYFALKRYEEAISSYQRAITLEPTVAFFHDNLGDAYFQQGQFARAVEQWRLVQELEPAYERYGLVLFMPGASVVEKIREAELRR